MKEIPNHSKKVFEGILHDVYQWEQELYDGSYTTFEKIVRRPASHIFAIQGDRIMVLIQSQPGFDRYFSLPGGWIEIGERPLEAAQRELLEETGFEAQEWVLFDEYTGTSKLYHHQYLYIAKNCQKVAEPHVDNGEMIEITWLTFEEFLQNCRDDDFHIANGFRFKAYEAMLEKNKKDDLRRSFFGK